MRLIVVRHGETEGNVRKLLQGQMDVPLNGNGMEQARKVAERFRTEKIDVAYSSDLKRARMTAEEIMKYHPGTPFHLVRELREKSYGIFEGKEREAIREAILKSGLPKHKYKPPKGESYEEQSRRVMAFLEKVKEKHKGQSVLWVTHGGIKRTLVSRLMGMPLEEAVNTSYGNTAVSIINFSDKGHEMLVYNCTKHLEENQ
jgi:probable phosphoglycerate mutase